MLRRFIIINKGNRHLWFHIAIASVLMVCSKGSFFTKSVFIMLKLTCFFFLVHWMCTEWQSFNIPGKYLSNKSAKSSTEHFPGTWIQDWVVLTVSVSPLLCLKVKGQNTDINLGWNHLFSLPYGIQIIRYVCAYTYMYIPL